METLSLQQKAMTISECASSVLGRFQQCLTLSASLHPREAALVEDQLARFSLWASNIGVFAPGRASMDHRLREAPDVHDAVITLLESAHDSMQDGLSSLKAIVNGQNRDPVDTSASVYEELESSLHSLASDITMLYRLSNTIRRASKESQDLKAAKTYLIRDDDGNDAEPLLQKFYEHYIRDKFPKITNGLSERLASSIVLRRKRILYRRSRYMKSAIRVTNTAPQPMIEPAPTISQQQDPTVQQLPEKGLQEGPPAQSQVPPSLQEQKLANSTVQSAAPSATTLAADSYKKVTTPSVVSATKTIALDNHEELNFPPAPLGHVRQRYNPQKKKLFAEYHWKSKDSRLYSGSNNESPTGAAASNEQHSDIKNSSWLLSPEVLKTRLEVDLNAEWHRCLEAVGEVICPFCLYALPCVSISDDKKWKHHVIGDLDAYVCLFDDCDTPNKLFNHSTDWLQHMRGHTLRWRCNSKFHGVLVFLTEEEYLNHMRRAHSGSFTEPQLRMLAERNGRPMGPMFELCPICGTSDDTVTRLKDHIAGHLRFLALKSLPAYEDAASDTSSENGSSATSKTRSTLRDELERHTRPTFVDSGPGPESRRRSLDWGFITNETDGLFGSWGDDMNVDDPIIESLLRSRMTSGGGPRHDQLQWNEKASSSRHTYMTLDDVRELIDEGHRLNVPVYNDHLAFYTDQLTSGHMWDKKVRELINADSIHYPQLQALADQVHAQGWPVCPETMAAVDQILHKQREAHRQIMDLNDRSQNLDYRKRPKYSEVAEVMKKIEELQAKPTGTHDLEKEQKRHEDWMRKGKKLFGKTNAPLHILKSHMEYVLDRNLDCFDIVHDKPRVPAEPASREPTPDKDKVNRWEDPKFREVFCICRRTEAGMMIECELCHEWYHGKCLKIARGKVKEDDKYTCPICDWRVKIPRDAARPKLEDLVAWQEEIPGLPFQPEEEEVLKKIIDNATEFRNHISVYCNPIMATASEAETQRFYLRKIEGAEILLAHETNFFRQELHKWSPVAPELPPVLEVSKSTRKPRPTKLQKLLAQYGVDDPDNLPEHVKGKANSLKRKALNAEAAAAVASAPSSSIMMVGNSGYPSSYHSFFLHDSPAQPTAPGLSKNAHTGAADSSSSRNQQGQPGLRADSMEIDSSSAHPSLFLRDSAGPGPQLLVPGDSTHDLEERLLRGTFDDDELNAHLSTDQGKTRVLEILSRTDTGRRRAEEIFGPDVWGDRNRDGPSATRDNDPIGIGVGNEGDGDDSMFVDLVNQDDDEEGDQHHHHRKKAGGAADPQQHPSNAAEILEGHDQATSWIDTRKES